MQKVSVKMKFGREGEREGVQCRKGRLCCTRAPAANQGHSRGKVATRKERGGRETDDCCGDDQ